MHLYRLRGEKQAQHTVVKLMTPNCFCLESWKASMIAICNVLQGFREEESQQILSELLNIKSSMFILYILAVLTLRCA